jgi:hypothetical protein
MKTTFWDWIAKTFYVLPGHPELDAKHSLVLTLDERNKYLPTNDEHNIPLRTQAFWLGMYIFMWVVLATQSPRADLTPGLNRGAYLFGFLTGLILILAESYLYANISEIVMLKNPAAPYIFNQPDVKSVEKGEKITDPDDYIDYSTPSGDYKVLMNNKNIPNDDVTGYVFTADTFLEKSSKGEITSVDLDDFLQHNPGAWDPTDTWNNNRNPERGTMVGELRTGEQKFNAANQNDIQYFSTKVKKITQVAYYISIIVITWAIFITSSKWGNQHKLQWIIMAFMISIIAGGVAVDGSDIISYNNIIFLKKRLIIYAISIAITSIFIV